MIKRGDIYFAQLSPHVGSEQGGRRPALVVQNDLGNRHSPTVIVAPITTRQKAPLPTHVPLESGECGLQKDSVALLEQVRTLDKSRLLEKLGEIDEATQRKVDCGLRVSLGLRPGKDNDG